MAENVDEILVGASGSVWVAPLGTAAPATSVAAPGAGWTNLGLVTEDGATFRDAVTRQTISAWQVFGPARRITTDRDTDVSFSLLQWSGTTVPFAFGGGTVTEPDPSGAPGEYRYDPPDPEDIDERALLLDWVDGTRNYRLVVPRGMVTEGVDTNLVRTGAAELPITFGALASAGVSPFYLMTNDSAFTPA